MPIPVPAAHVSHDSQPWVLVVDPNETDGVFVSEALNNAGFLTEVVQSGEKALERLPERTWHAMVVERHLPGMDGFATTLCARASASALPVVMATRQASRLSHEQAHVLDGYLAKPFKEQAAVELAIHQAVVNRASKMAREELQSALSRISAGLHHW